LVWEKRPRTFGWGDRDEGGLAWETGQGILGHLREDHGPACKKRSLR